jgi:hypothetical protein
MNIRVIITRPQIKGKMIRALRVWHTSTYIELICKGWKASGKQARGWLSDEAISQADPDKIVQLVRGECSDAAMIDENHEEEE